MKRIISILLFSLFFAASFQAAATEDIQNYQSQFTSDDVLSSFGQQRTYHDPLPYQGGWGIDAQLNTNIECGKIQFSTNIQSTIDKLKKLPNAIIDYIGGSFPALIDAAPILALCSTDPVMCSELKNLNLKLDADIGLQTNSCNAINKYIDNQSDKGKMEAYNKELQSCVTQKSGGDPKQMLEAMNSCQNSVDPNNVLVADIINRKMNTTLTKAQNIIQSVLSSAGHMVTQNDNDRYALLNASLGEMQLQVNGGVVPVLPSNNTIISPNDVAQFFLARSSSIACDNNSLYNNVHSLQSSSSSDPSTRYLENILLKSFNTSLVDVDVTNLSDISKSNQNVICSFLGRSIALKSMDYFISDVSNSMNSVENNDYIPDPIRKKYSSKSAEFFTSLKEQLNPEESYPINVVRVQIANMAKVYRAENRALAATVTKQSLQNAEAIQVSDSCDSVYNCN